MSDKEKLLEKFSIGKELAKGSFSTVYEGFDIQNGNKIAIKAITKDCITKQGWINLNREIEILLHIKHPNILQLETFIDTPTHLYLILEFMEGGELFEQIVKRGSFGEKDASQLLLQVIRGIGYLHENGVVHRDLKPENILCSLDLSRIVVGDFGLAKVFGRGELLKSTCGTPAYAAPEIFRGEAYDKSVDMWSIGVIAFVLLSGCFPFFFK